MNSSNIAKFGNVSLSIPLALEVAAPAQVECKSTVAGVSSSDWLASTAGSIRGHSQQHSIGKYPAGSHALLREHDGPVALCCARPWLLLCHDHYPPCPQRSQQEVLGVPVAPPGACPQPFMIAWFHSLHKLGPQGLALSC